MFATARAAHSTQTALATRSSIFGSVNHVDQNLPNDPVAPMGGGEVCLYFSDSVFHVLQNAACLPRIFGGIREI